MITKVEYCVFRNYKNYYRFKIKLTDKDQVHHQEIVLGDVTIMPHKKKQKIVGLGSFFNRPNSWCDKRENVVRCGSKCIKTEEISIDTLKKFVKRYPGIYPFNYILREIESND